MVLLAFVLGENTLLTMQEVFALAVFATATNLLLGQGGLVSFGQAVFYGLGAYTVTLGWLHWQLPFWATFIIAPVLGAIVAVPVGLVALRARRLYFALSTLAFSELGYQLVESRYDFTKGANGVFGPFVPVSLTYPRTGYFFLLAVTVVSLLLLWKVNYSPFGLVLRAIRENRDRMQALGVNVYLHQLIAFVVSGAFCALAGAMFVVFSQSSYPELFDWTTSGEPIFMAVIGGMGTFLGPALGALVYQFGHDQLVLYFSDWQLVLGGVLLLIVMFWPEGILGALIRVVALVRNRFGRRSSGE
jgi:branched-chain amino acid transport system permease protein